MKVKTKVRICVAFVWIGALVAILAPTFGNWCLWTGIAIVAVAGTCRYTLIRCPHCKHALLDGSGVPSKCPYCGESLE